jgi:hypothetical protein
LELQQGRHARRFDPVYCSAHLIGALTDEGRCQPGFEQLQLRGKRIERDDDEFPALDVGLMRLQRAGVGFGREHRPAAGVEDAVQLGIFREDVLDQLDGFV